ncbi:protein FAR1-RELATED SEQUENCE 3-like [Helianthus annuus]|uniref:protein FAR1-RELATED SEQUENCE 3-like n=1 Tax=Helianthus annuus TaxID=4232 RepID=UPI000B8F40C1|nr:protein FAR1-RELATED SEQUENCE 3-like [Helianthus annuus]
MASNTLADGGDDAPNYQLRGVEQVSPNTGTKRYILNSPSSLTPAEGMLFDTVDDAYNFYKTDAEAGEAHNHDFVHEEDLHLLKENRGINPAHEEMINKMSHLNIGLVRAFNIMKEVYNMMFVPFTGIDNHNRNVTLGAAILGSETAETYSWLLRAIKNAYGYAPPVIVTDQDPAMKRAIADVWPESRHRLCMWHIMDKLTTKVGAALCSNTDFRKRLSAAVWTDSLLPETFEAEWSGILNDFGLTDHEWLTYIYRLRESWIPAYYREEEMSGLMRTSSSYFDTAIEAQRNEHRKNDHDTRYTNLGERSDFVLEKQAAQIYTRTIFLDVQLEIQHAIHRCTGVMIREEDVTVKCICNRFEQFGLLCSHIFCVLRILDVRKFPKQYILRRWTREAVPNTSPGSILTDGGDPDHSEEVNRCVREISHATEYVVNKLISKFDKLSDFRDHIKEFMSVADEAQINAPPKTRRNRFAELLGVAPESTATIRVPVGTRFKGCGSHKRLKSQKERAISQSGSKPRQCSLRKKYGHNRVTCWKYTVAVPEAGASRNAEGNEDIIREGDAATVVEGDGPGSNDADDVFYTSGNDADMDDENMAE